MAMKEEFGEDAVFGPMAMVKIDGSRIKRLRESYGLTQLYVATAVGVTTDTISRWENGRYPNIKRDNGVRLAETFEVDLSDILLADNLQESEEKQTEQPKKRENSHITESEIAIQKIKTFHVIERFLLLKEICKVQYNKQTVIFLALFSFFVIMMLAWGVKAFFMPSVEGLSSMPSAKRIVPKSSLPNQRVPVIIQVQVPNTDNGAAVILREKLQENILSKISSKEIYPEPAQISLSPVPEIKWLAQIEGKKNFTYVLNAGQHSKPIVFDGTISSRGESKHAIEGCQQIMIGRYHWADENSDGVIDDREIILVYDHFSKVKGFAKEIEEVERIWLGSGYRWNEQTGKIDIEQTTRKNHE